MKNKKKFFPISYAIYKEQKVITSNSTVFIEWRGTITRKNYRKH